jgi:uncharacterized membrane protein YidH (DUF202 family)
MMDGQEPTRLDDTRVRCVGCGYELSGTAIGGTCPECGRPTRDSIRAARRVSHNSSTSSSAIVGLVLSILGLISGCLIVSPFAIWLYYRTRDEVARGDASPDSMGIATAGLVMGWIGTALLLLSCCFGIAWVFLVAGVAAL